MNIEQTLSGNFEQKANIIKTFNKQSLDLITQMVHIVGDKELVNLKSKFSMIIKVNSTRPIKEFLSHVYKYKDKIIKRDEDFFLINKDSVYDDNESKNLMNNVLDNNKNSEENIDFVKSLKLDIVWNNLSDKSKNMQSLRISDFVVKKILLYLQIIAVEKIPTALKYITIY